MHYIWTLKPESEKILQTMNQCLESGIKVNLDDIFYDITDEVDDLLLLNEIPARTYLQQLLKNTSKPKEKIEQFRLFIHQLTEQVINDPTPSHEVKYNLLQSFTSMMLKIHKLNQQYQKYIKYQLNEVNFNQLTDSAILLTDKLKYKDYNDKCDIYLNVLNKFDFISVPYQSKRISVEDAFQLELNELALFDTSEALLQLDQTFIKFISQIAQTMQEGNITYTQSDINHFSSTIKKEKPHDKSKISFPLFSFKHDKSKEKKEQPEP
ncbi:hypothetical protein L3V83_04940 [Thiotrichales bacterium 19X7-9]|nr:hypothetical protein [Thiotrichales bacterium 19X7-9]